ncbi:BTB/POZ domain-containing protein 9-like protein [Dinothrombium tinctorium]|uniref:BTB/POZ domain-containing protein 9 n=1 Tax=Dinothrombium tinctorium TaxID=1965070 RepID=A0A443R609_9ACAR|nr:BTB/POZ domain-containing protein 9-like protein [Dinothrombium tinctorium]
MSDNHHNREVFAIGEDINHTNHLSEDIGALYLNEDYSDVTLVVDGNPLPGHKVILASRSEYFRAMLFGGLKESHQTSIDLKVTSLTAFKLLLKYIYTGHMSLSSIKEEMILDILGLSHQYGFTTLEEAISDYLKANLSIKNVCHVYDAAILYCLDSLANVCSTFIDRHAVDIIRHESFYNLSSTAFKDMISRDSFCAPEVDIFNAVGEWVKRNGVTDYDHIMECVRLPLMSLPDLLNVVRSSELVSPDAILDAIAAKNESRDTDLKYRGCLIPEENVATPRHGAQVLTGEMKSALLDGDDQNYDSEKGYTRHHIDGGNDQGILIKLGTQSIINHIRLLLWDKDTRSYSYYIEVSMDQNDWVRVIDYSQYLCRSWQYLYFPSRVVKYIRVVGTHNSVNRVFHLVSFQCMYTNKPFKLDRGVIVPTHNVASMKYSACVIEGVSRSRNALINGDWKNYDWDTGYTCHQLGSGAIVVQLAQPYMIDSMRLLLWDIDSRTYSYYIEVSTDQQTWKMVVDKRNESCRSWQLIRFPRRPVVFIRIVGTFNTANEVFHCVHFECPSQIVDQKTSDESESSNFEGIETSINNMQVGDEEIVGNETVA